MIHKRYMDFIKHKPHLNFAYLRNTSLQGVKAIVNTKTVRCFVLTHQATQENKQERPFISMVKNLVHKWRPFTATLRYKHRQNSENTSYARTLPDKNIPHSS